MRCMLYEQLRIPGGALELSLKCEGKKKRVRGGVKLKVRRVLFSYLVRIFCLKQTAGIFHFLLVM